MNGVCDKKGIACRGEVTDYGDVVAGKVVQTYSLCEYREAARERRELDTRHREHVREVVLAMLVVMVVAVIVTLGLFG